MEKNHTGGREAFKERQSRIISYLKAEDIDCAVLEDTEGRRNLGVRYLTGHPGDALLFLFASGRTVLVPWDIHLAESLAQADRIVPYTDLGRRPEKAYPAILTEEGVSAGRCEISSATPFPLLMDLRESLPETKLICRWDGIDSELKSLRMIKDAEELALLRTAARITDGIVDELEGLLGEGVHSETDVALLIERRALEEGAEGMGFESIIAGPSRSFGIHAFPSYSGGTFTAPGLSIIDFGVKVGGYTSDVTLTVTRGSLPAGARKKLDLVRRAYDLCLSMVAPGASTLAIARAVDELFASHGEHMPHGLGHGIGLEAHEAPNIRNREDSDCPLEPGMVVTMEPGLYHPETGGARLENDLLITGSGFEVLTSSRILSFPR